MRPRDGGRIDINADEVFIDENLGVPEIGFRKLGADGQHAIAGLQHFLNLRAAHAIAEAQGMISAYRTFTRRGGENGFVVNFGNGRKIGVMSRTDGDRRHLVIRHANEIKG